MAAPETVVSTQAGWLATFLAILTQTSEVFEHNPALKFVLMGLLGAFAGFGLLVEQGRYDDVPVRKQIRSLFLRLGIGAVIGVGVWAWWNDGESNAQGIWLIGTVVASSAPIDVWRMAVDALITLLKKRKAK